MSSPTPCPLCAQASGAALWRNEALRVIAVDDPDYPGFTRVVWRRHVAEMTELAEAERDILMRAVFAVEAVQRAVLGPDKVNLASFGNVVPHLHWHVIPRWRDDRHFPDPVWAPPRVAAGAETAAWLERRARALRLLPVYYDRLGEALTGL
ncbi:HIT family protein [Pigmentiphaga soli]|uniref:HIT family protein n=1 Tax=Pigmentiphaga soli TaxID=1007095 RepID=A0ABP8HBY2_9BURK